MNAVEITEIMRLASLLATARVRYYAARRAPIKNIKIELSTEIRVIRAKDNLQKYLKGLK